MVYGQTPFADIPFIPKMNAICNESHVIRFASCANPAAADAMRSCLDRNPRTRITIPVRYAWEGHVVQTILKAMF